MEKRNNSRGLLSRIMGNIFASWTLVAAAAAAAVAIVLTLVHLNRNTTISIGSDNRIDPTPTLIASMKSIGEWEFLSISDEEMIDTVRHGFFSDDELVRIYYGTLRLGIDMSQADADWIAHSGDSVTVTLPSFSSDTSASACVCVSFCTGSSKESCGAAFAKSTVSKNPCSSSSKAFSRTSLPT